MHRNHNLGQIAGLFRLCQLFRQAVHTQVVGARINIHKIHFRTAVQGAIGTGHECDGAGPHPIAPPHTQRKAGNVQCTRCAVDRHGMPDAAVVGDGLFEGGNNSSLGEEVRAQDIYHSLDVNFRDVLATVGNHY